MRPVVRLDTAHYTSSLKTKKTGACVLCKIVHICRGRAVDRSPTSRKDSTCRIFTTGLRSIHYAAAANVRNLSEYACASLYGLKTARIVCGVQSYDWSSPPHTVRLDWSQGLKPSWVLRPAIRLDTAHFTSKISESEDWRIRTLPMP